MPLTAQAEGFSLPDEYRTGIIGKRVLITGAGKEGSLGRALALSAGFNGAAVVGVHFHSSSADSYNLVRALREAGVNAFAVQADVTSLGDLWATRGYVIEQMGGLPPDLLICNSGLTEKGYRLGQALKAVPDEPLALRRARVRQHFIDSLYESRIVLDTKIDGFLALTHLWAGEAVYHQRPLQILYMSSRQAVDPGAAVPGYVLSNWAVLQLPKVLAINLAQNSKFVSSFCILFPFIRTRMTGEYANNSKVFGRWQPRMLEPHEAAKSLIQLLARPAEELAQGLFALFVEGTAEEIRLHWKRLSFDLREESLHGCE